MHYQIDTAKEEEVPSFVSPHQLFPANVIHGSFSPLKSKLGKKNNDAKQLCRREMTQQEVRYYNNNKI